MKAIRVLFLKMLMRGTVLLAIAGAAECFAPTGMPSLRAGNRAAAIQRSSAPSAATSLRMQKVDDKTEVREYFNSEGFNR